MSKENDEYIEFSLTQKDTRTHKAVAEIPRPEMPLVTLIPHKKRLKSGILNTTIFAIIWKIRGIYLETDLWNFKKIYKHIMTDSLYKNSLFTMTSTFVLGGLGFFFWIIIAHLYKTENVGIATTLISIMTLLSSFTILGLNSSLTRYLPKSANRNELINSSFVIVTVATLLPAGIFFLGLQIFSPQLLFLRSNIFYILSFIIFTIFTSWNILIDSIFMAFRAANNILIKNTIISILKLMLPFALIVFGAYGIFASTASAFALGVLAGLIILTLKFKIRPSISVNFFLVKELSIYSLANYMVIFIRGAPALILPVIILNLLSAKYAAYFYIAAMI